MLKDFNSWNLKKQHIHQKPHTKIYHEGDVWWCSLGVNIGREQDGKGVGFSRPVLIIKYLSKDTCLVLPITTSNQTHKYRIDIGLVNNNYSKAIVSQMKVIDIKRLENKLGVIDQVCLELIRKTIREMF